MEMTEQFLSSTAFFAQTPGPLLAMTEFDYNDNRLLTLRMEDLVAYPIQGFRRIFDHFGVGVDDDFWETISQHSFSAKTGGRLPGQVDFTSHYRSGNPSDWVHHMSFQQAERYYQKHQWIVDKFYPEVTRLFIYR